ncbi:MAG TPA: MerR family transcriptional regulator [Pyrinomonadaceae bacterium]|nr:MerR family transcriptional regulator [Pyrinomonadaceae bacterium]
MNRAAVSIPEKLFFKIGEVCDITGIQAHVLRYWESEFPMLAPQKNRAGQRTYRKRDVEMVLRIKELLYEDQYTIAGAKKRLTNEIRGASKLKVVTPEMGAQALNTQPAPQLVPTHAPEAEEPPPDFEETPHEPAAPVQSAYPTRPEPPPSDESRAALRRLREQLRDIMLLLEAEDARPDTHRR